MLFNLTMFPTAGRKASISTEVSKVINLIDKSGLPYKLGPMGTAIEGDWDTVMALINRARKMLRRSHDRIYIQITVDDRKGAKSRLSGKMASIEKRLKREVKK